MDSNLTWMMFLCKQCHGNTQQGQLQWTQHVRCSRESVHGEEYVPVPLTRILIWSEMGAAFLWENTHIYFSIQLIISCFSSVFSRAPTHLLFLLGLSPYYKMIFLSVKLLPVVWEAQPTECFLTVGTQRDRTWVL